MLLHLYTTFLQLLQESAGDWTEFTHHLEGESPPLCDLWGVNGWMNGWMNESVHEYMNRAARRCGG